MNTVLSNDTSTTDTDRNDETEVLDSALTHGRLKNSETLGQLDKLFLHLSASHAKQLSELIRSFPCLFSDIPGRTCLLEHDIEVGDTKPIKQRFYRVNFENRQYLNAESICICY